MKVARFALRTMLVLSAWVATTSGLEMNPCKENGSFTNSNRLFKVEYSCEAFVSGRVVFAKVSSKLGPIKVPRILVDLILSVLT